MTNTTITVRRKENKGKATTGRLFLGDVDFCFTLEDVVRAPGVKVPGETAIPAGKYHYIVNRSNRFGRDMLLVFSDPKDLKLKADGVEFAGVRVHGGNTHLNTEGCVLTARNKIDDETIQGTTEAEITQWAKDRGGKGEFIVVNDFT